MFVLPSWSDVLLFLHDWGPHLLRHRIFIFSTGGTANYSSTLFWLVSENKLHLILLCNLFHMFTIIFPPFFYTIWRKRIRGSIQLLLSSIHCDLAHEIALLLHKTREVIKVWGKHQHPNLFIFQNTWSGKLPPLPHKHSTCCHKEIVHCPQCRRLAQTETLGIISYSKSQQKLQIEVRSHSFNITIDTLPPLLTLQKQSEVSTQSSNRKLLSLPQNMAIDTLLSDLSTAHL